MVVANRLPVDRVEDGVGAAQWRASPGGLVAALEPVMVDNRGTWVGWSGVPDDPTGPFDSGGMPLVPVSLSAEEVSDYYEGFSNATVWPLYHDVTAPPTYERRWWESYREVNRRFAAAADEAAAPGATVWVQDYQLQLVPSLLRAARPDVRIGFFNHIPFPGYELYARLPWRVQVLEGLLGADLIGFQRRDDASNFLRAARKLTGAVTRGSGIVTAARDGRPSRRLRAASFPISIDTAAFEELARRPEVVSRAETLRSDLGQPETVLLGVDRLDYTKGILHRLRAFGELLDEGRLQPSKVVLVQVASPSRDRVEEYQRLRDEVELSVGRINGDHSSVGRPVIHYLHQSFPKAEMAALYLAADVMLVTPLRDGMNLVAKEFVACRTNLRGSLVLSEFTGAADELGQAHLVNPYDIDGMKAAILDAVVSSPSEQSRRMRPMRRRVKEADVHHWANTFLGALDMVTASSEVETPTGNFGDTPNR